MKKSVELIAPTQVKTVINLPASKSLSNRALIINALCGGACRLTGIAVCDDTDVMCRALNSNSTEVNVGAAGTAMRFLTAFYAAQEGRLTVLDGSQRMRQRPIGTLVDALRALGAHIEYLDEEGFPPLRIHGKRLKATAPLTMRGDVSSQFITAVLLIAPAIGGLTINLNGEILSRPYIDMTIEMMRHFGAQCQWTDAQTIAVNSVMYTPCDFEVEADWSAASYWLAMQALMPSWEITLRGLHNHSLQGDSMLLEILRQMGFTHRFSNEGLSLNADNVASCCCSTFADLRGMPDVAQTLAVLLCLLGRPFRLTGLRTLRIKETDRIEALRLELLKLGFRLDVEGNDALNWHFAPCEPVKAPRITTYDDHRMAMAFACAAIKFPRLIIEDPDVVSKSYPEFWDHLRLAGFQINELQSTDSQQ